MQTYTHTTLWYASYKNHCILLVLLFVTMFATHLSFGSRSLHTLGTTLSLPSIQLPVTLSARVAQATGECTHSSLTTKPQPSDINSVKTAAVAKPSMSPTLATGGPRVSTRAVASNGRADLTNPSHSMPTSLSQERTTTSAHHVPPSSMSPRQPPSTRPSSMQLPSSLGDGGRPLSSPAGGRTTAPHSLPSSHPAATKAAARGTVTWNKYRLCPWPAGYKTRYIPWERSALEWSRESAEGEARGTSKAERKHWPFPRDVKGLTSCWPGIQLTYTMLRLF